MEPGAQSFHENARRIVETIESTPGVYVGQHVSVAIDPYSGATSISHYDATNGNLRHARSVGSGGNCGEHNDWNCWLRDGGSGTDRGRYSSLALEPNAHMSTYDWPKFAYYDASLGVLKYAAYDWPGTWHYTIVDDRELPDYYLGMHASLTLNSNKTPHIAYTLYNDIDDWPEVQYVTKVADGPGNCGDGDWQCRGI